jgi:protoheme IX farnesyltransferase
MSSARATRAVDLIALVKPRILAMSLVVAAGAASLAPLPIAAGKLALALAGTALIVGCANALNMWLERDTDCLMARTKNRPLPGARLSPTIAIAFAAALGTLALPVLALAGIVPAALGLVALLLYVGVYTPMKLRSHHATWIGAVPGAMPALIGWTAATGRIDVGGLAVFAVLFFWQIPHTHAIAIYRQRDYDAAGMKTLPGTHGVAAARRAIAAFLVVQVAASVVPFALGVAGPAYLATALVLGAIVLAHGARGFAAASAARWARQVFLVSIVYLPVLFGVMVIGGRP